MGGWAQLKGATEKLFWDRGNVLCCSLIADGGYMGVYIIQHLSTCSLKWVCFISRKLYFNNMDLRSGKNDL